MEDLSREEVQQIINQLPPPVAELLQQHPEATVAGGVVRDILSNRPYNDIDIFAGCACAGKDFWGNARAQRDGTGLYRWQLPNVPNPAQLIRIAGDPYDHMLNTFDFTCCAGLVRWDRTERSWFGQAVDGFHVAIRMRRLTLIAPDRARVSTYRRLVKLVGKGFVANDATLAAIGTALVLGLPCVQEFLVTEETVSAQMTKLLTQRAIANREPEAPENWEEREVEPLDIAYQGRQREERPEMTVPEVQVVPQPRPEPVPMPEVPAANNDNIFAGLYTDRVRQELNQYMAREREQATAERLNTRRLRFLPTRWIEPVPTEVR